MILHAAHTFPNVVIASPDTDVFVLVCAVTHSLNTNMFFQSAKQLYKMSEIKEIFTEKMCAALLGLHSFTGCDTVSSFRGKGKKKAITALKSSPDFINTFADFGMEWAPDEALLKGSCCCHH